MRGYQEQNREEDLGGSPGIGWTRRPKADNIQHVEPGYYSYHTPKHFLKKYMSRWIIELIVFI